MNKNRFYIFIIVGLLISNLLLAGFMMMNKPPQHLGPRNLIIERLHFNEKQIRQYDALIGYHRMQISGKEHDLMNLKSQYYSLLRSGNRQKENSLVDKIGKTNMEMEKINFKHFQDIKRICRPDQVPYFDHLINDFESLFAPGSRRPHE
ncbi:hypothetical protein [uncultured Chryseobacterium sp.]|uniref:hypothetical protein n=1 Tax=uncultured Chryseobacterium sp. TaxID=259322 RepID=UPI0025E62D57|nr:hypothetical protein [uncultured Chryseobacterium sp.]